jgi:hypothetical protein
MKWANRINIKKYFSENPTDEDYIQINHLYSGNKKLEYNNYQYVEDLLCDIDKFNNSNK